MYDIVVNIITRISINIYIYIYMKGKDDGEKAGKHAGEYRDGSELCCVRLSAKVLN